MLDEQTTTSAFTKNFLGRLSYSRGLEAQARAASSLVSSSSAIAAVLGLEHEPVITLGKRGSLEADLKVPPARLQGIELHRTERGGQATLHSPGQLVIYPCAHLGRLHLGVRAYVEGLESATIAFLADLGIDAHLAPDEPGLYTSRGKIVFYGLQVRNGVTAHGLAINVANDLALFRYIRSCGKDGESFDRVSDHCDSVPSLESLFDMWNGHFMRTFS